MRFPCTLLALYVLLALVPIHEAAGQQVGQLDSTRQQLEHARQEAERILTSQADVYKQLDVLERELELSSKVLRQIRRQSQDTEAEIRATADTLADLRALSQTEGTLLSRRLRHVYSTRDVNDFYVPLSEPLFVERSLLRVNYGNLMQHDQRRLGALHASVSFTEQVLSNLQLRKTELSKLVKDQSKEERRAKEALTKREHLLAGLKDETRQISVEISALESSASTIGDVFTEIESQARAVSDQLWNRERDLSMQMKGKFYWPLRGKLITRFGTTTDRRSGLSSKSNGIGIQARKGDKVVAALTGEVIYIGWARGLERFVIVDHGGSIYTLYGNLDQLSVKEGDHVIRGEPFAVAATNKIHFEVRDGKAPINPIPWLRD